jgi:pimeloyl-ACP methyl ester carboxylesterase
MKRAVLLHGTGGNPEAIWFPWLKAKLETEGYTVWAPLLPDNFTPNRQVYNDFLLGSDWDFAENLIIGHSSGAVSVLNLLMDKRCPPIKMGVLLGAWAGGLPLGSEVGNTQFDNLFPTDGFDFELIKSKATQLAFLHGDDDPFCPLDQAQYLAEKLQAPLVVVPGGHHLGSKFIELPELWQVLESQL